MIQSANQGFSSSGPPIVQPQVTQQQVPQQGGVDPKGLLNFFTSLASSGLFGGAAAVGADAGQAVGASVAKGASAAAQGKNPPASGPDTSKSGETNKQQEAPQQQPSDPSGQGLAPMGQPMAFQPAPQIQAPPMAAPFAFSPYPQVPQWGGGMAQNPWFQNQWWGNLS